MLLSASSFIISLYLNAVNPPTPESMFAVKIRVEGLKYNIYFRGRGGGTQGEWIVMSTTQKGPFYGLKRLNTLVPHFSLICH